VPTEALLHEGLNDDDDLEIAIDDCKIISQGEYVAGSAGRSNTHNLYEKRFLDSLNEQMADIKNQLEQTKQPGGIDPMGQQMPDQYDPALMQQFTEIAKAAQMLAGHLQIDTLPKSEYAAASLIETQSISQPNQVPMPSNNS
jgi:hypothetical protein